MNKEEEKQNSKWKFWIVVFEGLKPIIYIGVAAAAIKMELIPSNFVSQLLGL
jgi:hypothetical protein